MKHAGTAALERLAGLLDSIRASGVLREKSPGVFYLRSKAFLHFHEDPAGLFADIRAPDGIAFDRIKVDEAPGRLALLQWLAEIPQRV